MKTIVVEMKPEESIYGKAMFVIASSHPRFEVGSRFDYGFMQIAVATGYTVVVLPESEDNDGNI